MEQPRFVLDILIILFSAGVGGAIFEKMRLPGVIGFLLTGALVGPSGLQLISDPEVVHTFAEFGVAFLLFEIGIELPLDELRQSFRKLLLAGFLQVTATLGLTTGLCILGGLPLNSSIVMGMLVTMSSTAVVMRILSQREEVDAPHGRLSLGILLFQDLCIIPFLLVVPLLAADVHGTLSSLVLAFAKAIVVLLLFALVSRFVLQWVMKQIAHLRSPDLFSIFAFLLAMGSAVLAQEIGLTLAAGAFVAGLVLNSSAYGHQLFAEIVPWRGVLLGVFFTTVGMLLDVQRALPLWEEILLFLGGVIVLKSLVVAAVLYGVLRERLGQALQTGLTLAQAGEFSFVLATAASVAGLIDEPTEQVFIAGSVLSLIFTPALIAAGPRLASLGSMPIERVSAKVGEKAKLLRRTEVDEDHVVIIGYGMAGRTLAQILRSLGLPYHIVDSNPYTEGKLSGSGEPFTFGDATRLVILKAVGIERAKAVVIAISDPAATRRCIAMIRSLAPDVHIVVRTRYARNLDVLLEDGASEVVAEEFESTIDLFSKALRLFDVSPQAIGDFAQEMRAEGYTFLLEASDRAVDPWLVDLLKGVSTHWIEVPQLFEGGRSIAELSVRATTGVNILAVRRNGRMETNPPPEYCIAAGDELLILGTGAAVAKFRGLLENVQ